MRESRRSPRRCGLHVLDDADRRPAALVARLRAPDAGVPAAGDTPLLPATLLPSEPGDAAADRGVAGPDRGGGAVVVHFCGAGWEAEVSRGTPVGEREM